MVKKILKPLAADFHVPLLLAAPGLREGVFSEGVVLIIEEAEQGTIGVLLNKPLSAQADFIRQEKFVGLQSFSVADQAIPFPNHFLCGGPVQEEFCWVLAYNQKTMHHFSIPSLQVHSNQLNIEAEEEILQHLQHKKAAIFELGCGYAGWGKKQLERELWNNWWLQVDYPLADLITTPYAERWNKGMNFIGVNPWRWVDHTNRVEM